MREVSTATGDAQANERSTIAATGSLAKHDMDGDGRINKSEMKTMARMSALYKAAAVFLAILTAIFAACTFGLTFLALQLSKDMHVVKTALSDGANMLIGTKAVTAMFSLLAVAAMSDDRLAKVTSLHVSFVLGGKLPSFLSDFEGAVPNITKYGLLKKFYSVVSVARLSETALLFATGEYGHKLMISDGIATMHVKVGNATETYLVCSDSVDCGAVYADSAEEAKELNDKAMATLPAQIGSSSSSSCFDPAETADYASIVNFAVCGDGENTVCSEAKVILDTCEAARTPTDACYKAELCNHANVCDPWKDEHCPLRRELFSADTEVSDRVECVDTPDHLLAAEAGRLSLRQSRILTGCAELRADGGCELDMVKDLCGKTCGVCDAKESSGRRRLAKCHDRR